jgi:hypothetical protein
MARLVFNNIMLQFVLLAKTIYKDLDVSSFYPLMFILHILFYLFIYLVLSSFILFIFGNRNVNKTYLTDFVIIWKNKVKQTK